MPSLRSFKRDIRSGIVVAILVMLVGVGVRYLHIDPLDRTLYEETGTSLGLDFGDWHDIFYTGAKGDGRVFATMAAEPFGDSSRAIRSVTYRYGRVGFPLSGWLVSVRREEWVLPAMLVVGLASVGAIGFLSGYLRDELGWPAWLLAWNPALYVGFAENTSEPVGLLLLCALFLSGSSAVVAMLAITRPTYLSVAIGQPKKLALGVLVGAALHVAVSWRFGLDPFTQLGGGLGPPVLGYLQAPNVVTGTIAVAAAGTLVLGVKAKNPSWIGAALLVLCFGPLVVEGPVNAIRAAGILPVVWAFGLQNQIPYRRNR